MMGRRGDVIDFCVWLRFCFEVNIEFVFFGKF